MASLPVGFHPDARADALHAYDGYRNRSDEAAAAFLLELENASSAIKSSPEIWTPYLHGTRCYLMKRFPYIIVYRFGDEEIEILAVAHGSRKPGFWTDRVKTGRD